MKELESCRVLLVAGGVDLEAAAVRVPDGSPRRRYAVTWATSLSLAVESLRRHRPDCVLADLDRPKAAHALELRRLREYLPCAALIAVAPAADRAAALAALRAGAEDCLETETLDAERLRRAIDIAFERSAARRRLMTLALRDLVTGSPTAPSAMTRSSAPSPAPVAAARCSRSCTSTSTTSTRSTTPPATPPQMRSCRLSPRGSPPTCAQAISSPASVAMSSR